MISPFPLPLLIVGSKFDLFQVSIRPSSSFFIPAHRLLVLFFFSSSMSCCLRFQREPSSLWCVAGTGFGEEESGLQNAAVRRSPPRRLAGCECCHALHTQSHTHTQIQYIYFTFTDTCI